MNSNPTQKPCDTCGKAVSTYDGIYFSKGDARRFLCTRCYNETISGAIGLDFEHLSFHPIILLDQDGESHTFHFQNVISEMQNERFVFSSEKNWMAFFERNLGKTKIKDNKRAYEFLMKFGLNRHYWNEYVFEGYVSHKNDMILLAGFPDISVSRPHSRENSESF